MSNKLFAFLVIVLVSLIVASIVGLIISINRFNEVRFPENKPSVLTEESVSPSKTGDNSTSTNDNSNPTTTTSKYILPSDTKVLTEADLIGMDYDTLNKAYNEIFARHGHDFNSDNLRSYFNNQSWYNPIPGKVVSVSELSNIENNNLTLIKDRIAKVK